MAQLRARFVTSPGFVSWSIRELTDFWASHVEWVLDADWLPYLTDKKGPVLPIPLQAGPDYGVLGAHLSGGIMVRPSNYETFTKIENVYLDVTDEQKAAVMKAAAEKIGTPYDLINIAGIAFHQNWVEKGHEICSVYIGDCTINQGVPLLRIPTVDRPSLTPRDIYLSPLWKSA